MRTAGLALFTALFFFLLTHGLMRKSLLQMVAVLPVQSQ